jgi:hypothetical protein
VDAPVKQFILSLNKKHNYNIVINEIANDERKIFVAREFEDVSGQEQDTLTFLQVRMCRGGRVAECRMAYAPQPSAAWRMPTPFRFGPSWLTSEPLVAALVPSATRA